jgi:hypothetical protein
MSGASLTVGHWTSARASVLIDIHVYWWGLVVKRGVALSAATVVAGIGGGAARGHECNYDNDHVLGFGRRADVGGVDGAVMSRTLARLRLAATGRIRRRDRCADELAPSMAVRRHR